MDYDEKRDERNPRPKSTSNNTPAIVLAILFSIVVLLLYAGWNLMSDDASNIADMKSTETVATSDIIETDSEAQQEVIEEPAPVEELEKETVVEKVAAETKPAAAEKPAAAKTSYAGQTAVHVVKDGETFFGIANKFNTSSENLKAMNPDINPNSIKVGITKIIVPVQAVHTVGPGDILRVVANKYGITVEALMAANGKKRNHSERGEKLLIPHKKKV